MTRKLPQLTPENTPFWTGGQAGRLHMHRCDDCMRHFHPPASTCPACLSDRVGPQPVSGKGEVMSFTINRQAWTPELTQPFVVAIVELDEQAGLRLLSNVVGCEPEAVHVGQRVEVSFEQVEDVWLPLFKPASEEPS